MMRGDRARLVLLLLSLFVWGSPAYAFYDWYGEEGSLSLRGLLSGSATLLQNPDDPLLFNRRNLSGVAGAGRLMLDANRAGLSFELHAEESYVPMKLQRGGSNLALLRGTERSDLLDWSHDARQSHLLIDRINLQYHRGRTSLKIGRQPVNLAATYYFTPNDFFAPFAAHTFFRDFKPGVDALRGDFRIGDLSQLMLIAVLGYSIDAGSDSGWSSGANGSRHSYLGRVSTVFGDFELAFLGGSVRRDRIVGGDFQGELFDWLGVRGEGHINDPVQSGAARSVEFALGLEHRFESSLNVRFEQFYHGSGASSSAAYSLVAAGQGGYLGRNYSAFGAGYEFTPLLTGDSTVVYNWMDASLLVAIYLRYSLSDESELALSVARAAGRRSQGGRIRSEFGLYPDALSLELRSYF